MKLSVQAGDIVIDPFNGASLSRDELENRLEPFIQQAQAQAALPLAVYLQLAQRRDRGLTYEKLECPQAALKDIEAYLARRPYAVTAVRRLN